MDMKNKISNIEIGNLAEKTLEEDTPSGNKYTIKAKVVDYRGDGKKVKEREIHFLAKTPEAALKKAKNYYVERDYGVNSLQITKTEKDHNRKVYQHDDERHKEEKVYAETSHLSEHMQKIKDLIDNIEIGNADAINASFSTVMAEKVSTRLDSLKQEVANVVFKDKIENNLENN